MKKETNNRILVSATEVNMHSTLSSLLSKNLKSRYCTEPVETPSRLQKESHGLLNRSQHPSVTIKRLKCSEAESQTQSDTPAQSPSFSEGKTRVELLPLLPLPKLAPPCLSSALSEQDIRLAKLLEKYEALPTTNSSWDAPDLLDTSVQRPLPFSPRRNGVSPTKQYKDHIENLSNSSYDSRLRCQALELHLKAAAASRIHAEEQYDAAHKELSMLRVHKQRSDKELTQSCAVAVQNTFKKLSLM
ncbi:hypothetical protein K435DRAFT_919732 [Dendrothele bispora CBS 962.96]|uniref:Uncharacterized protein n=1 Tax=Dendrothele bispora (strain CBS 962.96) TaxID=1314807 RepID=A0A4S8LFH3_DENBC|nr:hypothetical protein K435DRAFT_919732 [Dendrothele bispora CBS 962.96]